MQVNHKIPTLREDNVLPLPGLFVEKSLAVLQSLHILIEHPVKKEFIMNFKQISCRALIAFGLVASATGVMAQSSASANGTATANVIRPITINATRSLAFGNVVPGAAAELSIRAWPRRCVCGLRTPPRGPAPRSGRGGPHGQASGRR